MKNDEVVVKVSKINRQGIFAARDFRKGETVTHWDMSNTITPEEYDSLPKSTKEHVSNLGHRKYLIIQPPERYINHSCEPNTYVLDGKDVALRNIHKGEEITSDYSTDSVGKYSFKCNCGSPNCRGIIYY